MSTAKAERAGVLDTPKYRLQPGTGKSSEPAGWKACATGEAGLDSVLPWVENLVLLMTDIYS